jgi:hypothetical protein
MLASSQIRVKKPISSGKMGDVRDKEVVKEERVMVPLGEGGGNIPVPRRRR